MHKLQITHCTYLVTQWKVGTNWIRVHCHYGTGCMVLNWWIQNQGRWKWLGGRVGNLWHHCHFYINFITFLKYANIVAPYNVTSDNKYIGNVKNFSELIGDLERFFFIFLEYIYQWASYLQTLKHQARRQIWKDIEIFANIFTW